MATGRPATLSGMRQQANASASVLAGSLRRRHESCQQPSRHGRRTRRTRRPPHHDHHRRRRRRARRRDPQGRPAAKMP